MAVSGEYVDNHSDNIRRPLLGGADDTTPEGQKAAFAINLDTLRVNTPDKIYNFFDGTDTYAATLFRCFPQFFFYQHLPNGWDDDSGGYNFDPGLILAVGIFAYILGTGYYFMKCEESRQVKNKLSDEVLLAHYASDKPNPEIDTLINEHIQRDKNLYVGYWKWWIFNSENKNENDEENKKYEGYEEARIRKLREFAQANKARIQTLMKAEVSPPKASEDTTSTARKAWDTTLQVGMYYAYAHWILWMLSTIVLYQASKGYGIDPEDPSHSDAPAWFTDSTLGFGEHDGMLLFQTLAPIVFALMVVGYQSMLVKPKNNDETTVKLQNIRDLYNVESEKTRDKSQDKEEVYTSFTGTHVLTGITTVLSWTLLTYIAAWPIQGFVMKVCNVETEPTTYIPVIFAVAITVGMIQVALKVQKMREEEQKLYDSHGKIYISAPKKNMWEFYKNHEHSYKLWYIGVGSVFGSGGLLLSRILFNGGMGNIGSGGEPMARQDLMFVGIGMCFAIMALKFVQYYAEEQRNEVVKVAGQKPRAAAA